MARPNNSQILVKEGGNRVAGANELALAYPIEIGVDGFMPDPTLQMNLFERLEMCDAAAAGDSDGSDTQLG